MTRLLLRLSPLAIVLGVVRLALVAAVGVLVVHPPEPDPVPRPVTYICRKSDVVCRELVAEAKAIQAAEQNR